MSSPVTSYTSRLREELRVRRFGPEPDELTELRDGLDDAVEAQLRNGLSRAEAEQRAVREFGEPAEIARLFETEIAVRRTFRASIALALLYPLLLGLWSGYASLFPDHHTEWQDGARIGAAFTLVGSVAWIFAVAGAVLLRLRGRTLNWPVQPIMIGCSGVAFASVIAIGWLAVVTVNSPAIDPLQARVEATVKVLSILAVAGMLAAGVNALRATRMMRPHRGRTLGLRS